LRRLRQATRFDAVSTGNLESVKIEPVRVLLGSEFEKVVERIVRNAYRTDMHFLPKDLQDPSWGGITEHSVALFRNATSVPIRILDSAQDMMLNDWEVESKSVF
jgi:hypothetical protein